MSTSVIGIVDTQQKAERIVNDLQRAGFALPELSLLYPSHSATEDLGFEHRTKAPEGATAGASAGGAIGGALGLLAGIGAIAIPGLGAFMAAGPLLGALSGAAAGAAAGGVSGALVGFGIPEIEAKRYEKRVASGNILVAVHVHTSEAARDASAVLTRDGARDVVATRDTPSPAS
jgi:hypothetical protein